ncbi:MAG: SDR family NAD(P)-dependent oxidoreductase, partial [Gammaproteobacteria bacterium]
MEKPHSKGSILITGCSSGIGKVSAFGLRERGYRVFATARKNAAVKELTRAGFEAFQLDLADSASIQRAVDGIFERSGGRLDALFNNAAFGQPGAVEDLTREVLRNQFETNLFGTHELTNLV